jgi:hypothetical protein
MALEVGRLKSEKWRKEARTDPSNGGAWKGRRDRLIKEGYVEEADGWYEATKKGLARIEYLRSLRDQSRGSDEFVHSTENGGPSTFVRPMDEIRGSVDDYSASNSNGKGYIPSTPSGPVDESTSAGPSSTGCVSDTPAWTNWTNGDPETLESATTDYSQDEPIEVEPLPDLPALAPREEVF